MTDTGKSSLIQADGGTITRGYMPGFGNDFETEALPGALPQGIRPSVKHSHRYEKIDLPYFRSAPDIHPAVTSLGQYRWDPVPHTDAPLTWLTGMRTMTTAGDVHTQVGMATHVYLVTESMQDAYFFSADSEMLVVPQEGRLRFATELGIIDVEPKEMARSLNFPAVVQSAQIAWPTRVISKRRWRPMRTAKCRLLSP